MTVTVVVKPVGDPRSEPGMTGRTYPVGWMVFWRSRGKENLRLKGCSGRLRWSVACQGSREVLQVPVVLLGLAAIRGRFGSGR